MRLPKSDSRYSWTSHVIQKMMHYGISESKIKQIIRFPSRFEEGIAPQTIAVMQPARTKRYQELWVMYKLIRIKHKALGISSPKFKIITAWRYPGKSPERDPIPQTVISEIKSFI